MNALEQFIAKFSQDGKFRLKLSHDSDNGFVVHFMVKDGPTSGATERTIASGAGPTIQDAIEATRQYLHGLIETINRDSLSNHPEQDVDRWAADKLKT